MSWYDSTGPPQRVSAGMMKADPPLVRFDQHAVQDAFVCIIPLVHRERRWLSGRCELRQARADFFCQHGGAWPESPLARQVCVTLPNVDVIDLAIAQKIPGLCCQSFGAVPRCFADTESVGACKDGFQIKPGTKNC